MEGTAMEEQLVETWKIHDRINRYLLDAIPPEALGSVSASKGRTVAEQFAHVHNVRLMWLGSAAPELLSGLQKIEKGGAQDKEALAAAWRPRRPPSRPCCGRAWRAAAT
jgi:uncharacterized damage-inducible protein DinB